MNSELKIGNFSRNSKMAVAAQLRLVAEQLEQGDIEWKGGAIKVSANHTGLMTIESDLMLSCREQPKVETPTVEEIVLMDPVCEAVYQMLDRLDPGQKKLTTFEHGEDEQWNEWIRAINNRGDYPEYLKGRMFEAKPYRNLNELGVWVVRLV